MYDMQSFSKARCSDVNRECEYGASLTKITHEDETRRVVDRTMGYDEISHDEYTGRIIETKEIFQICKYCGNRKIISSETYPVKINYTRS